jgi:hypothetical protein
MRFSPKSVVVVAVIAAALIYGAYAPTGRAKADGQETTKRVVTRGVVEVDFANETGRPVILCVSGLHGTASFDLDVDGIVPVRFVDDGYERVISAFAPGQKTAVCYFPLVPGNFCVIIQQGALVAKKKDCTPEAKATTNKAL